MNLLQLRKANTIINSHNKAVLIYGEPKTGKTHLAATAAKSENIDRVFFIDIENGSETLLGMDFTDKEAEKITLIKIPDTKAMPRACETILKAFHSSVPVTICNKHGKVTCAECPTADSVEFDVSSLTHRDVVIIDSGSQLSDSAMRMSMLGRPSTAKPEFDDFGRQGTWLSDILSTMQAAVDTNFIMVTHALVVEEEMNGIKKDRRYPLVGTKAFCSKVAKFFGTVIYCEIRLGKFHASSKATSKADTVMGTRSGVNIEDQKTLDLTFLFK